MFIVHENDHFLPADDILPLLYQRRHSHSVVLRDDKMVIIGGMLRDSPLDDCEMIDVRSGTSRRLRSMKEARYDVAAVIYCDSIIAVGGRSKHEALSSVESYSFETGVWSYLTPMLAGREKHCAAVVYGKVFVIGGVSYNSVDFYDPVTSSWTFHQDTDIARNNSSLVLIK